MVHLKLSPLHIYVLSLRKSVKNYKYMFFSKRYFRPNTEDFFLNFLSKIFEFQCFLRVHISGM